MVNTYRGSGSVMDQVDEEQRAAGTAVPSVVVGS